MNVTFELTEKFQQIIELALEKAFSKIQHERAEAESHNKMLLSAQEAAEALGICEKSLWNYSRPRGTIPALKIGSRTMYDSRDLQVWINEQKRKGVDHVED